MSRRGTWIAVGLAASVVAAVGNFLLSPADEPSNEPGPAPATPRLTAIGPRVISNATAYPVIIWGEHLPPGTRLVIRARTPIAIPTASIDARHLTALIPAGLELLPEVSDVEVTCALEGPRGEHIAGEAQLHVVNDLAFTTPSALALFESSGGLHLAIASPTTDALRVLDASGDARVLATGDRPRALARWRDAENRDWLAIGHESGELAIVPASALEAAATATTALGAPGGRTLALPNDIQDLAIDPEENLAYATSHQLDGVAVVDLSTGQVARTLPAGVNPRAIALAEDGTRLVVANIASEDVSIIDLATGRESRLRPGPGTPILGGHTEPFRELIMGGKAGRALVASGRLHVAFMSTLGPNIGPNPERMEVSMNGGVSVLDTRRPAYLRHVSMIAGVPEGLALDDARGLLYVADGSTGRVVVYDAKLLAESDAAARGSLLATLDLPIPEGTPLIRPAADFGVQGRARASLHFGPKALALASDGRTLFVLGRFSGAVAAIDVSRARAGELALLRVLPPWVERPADARRQGEIVYFTDLGNTRMTCDTCHPEGHVGGVLFSKGRPMRIYRGLGLRGIRESPPYFTPSRLPSIRRTSENVLARNRFFNPRPIPGEADALTTYVGAIPMIPNPWRGPRGELAGPRDRPGDAVRGLALFEGKAGCAAATCHPPPSFTGDQALATRGALHKLGTPIALGLRPEMQDLGDDYGQPPPSLVGVWDVFPLFLSGAGGNEVQGDGTIAATHPDALGWMLENPAWTGHGGGPSLTDAQRDDLIAFLLSI